MGHRTCKWLRSRKRVQKIQQRRKSSTLEATEFYGGKHPLVFRRQSVIITPPKYEREREMRGRENYGGACKCCDKLFFVCVHRANEQEISDFSDFTANKNISNNFCVVML